MRDKFFNGSLHKNWLFAACFALSFWFVTPWAHGQDLINVQQPIDDSSTASWKGFYAGGGYSGFGGSQTNLGSMALENDISGRMTAGYAGINFQNGALVYGAEAAYAVGSVYDSASPEFHFSNLIDIKARLGIGHGDTLVYGVAGWSNAKWDAGSSQTTANGITAGIGVDHLVSDYIFIGAEYLYRDLEEGNSEFVAPLSSVQIRAGLKF